MLRVGDRGLFVDSNGNGRQESLLHIYGLIISMESLSMHPAVVSVIPQWRAAVATAATN